jgi:predicted  nucleic acid-binding Zn-ribbon protein
MATSKSKAKSAVAEEPIAESVQNEVIENVHQEEISADKTDDDGEEKIEVTIERKLIALYSLQQIETQIDKIKIIRGELPLEVQDLEDEIAGLETRIENLKLEADEMDKLVNEKKASIKESQTLIKRYEEQQMNVRNNREYDSLTKEVEYQGLEIQLSEKRIREFTLAIESKNASVLQAQELLKEKTNDLDLKRAELNDIVEETEKEENELARKSEDNQKYIEDRLVTAYKRIRKNARNGLAVVLIERGACGGCFNKIPPQHQLEISMHKKIIVCEYCGRILVDEAIANTVNGMPK